MKTIKHGPFLGLNNRLQDYALSVKDKGSFLSKAENVDIDNAGLIRRRTGTALIQAMTGAHSVLSLSATSGYFVRASTLYSFANAIAYSEAVVVALTSNAAMSYLQHDGVIYFSNGTDSGKIKGATVYPMGLPTPEAPAVAATTGTLVVGKYKVAIRYINTTTGEAGGLSSQAVRDVAITGGILVTLPGATNGATHVQVFVSDLNGSQTYLHSTVTAATATASIANLGSRTTTEEADYLTPLPAGWNLFVHKGRLCSTNGKVLSFGVPYRYGYVDPVAGRIEFKSNIKVAIPTDNGVYVCTQNETYWMPGDLKLVEQFNEPLPYGASEGSAFAVPHNGNVGWFGAKGFVIADDQGQVSAVTQDVVDVTLAANGCSAVFESRGYRRVVSNGYCMNLENSAVSTYTDYAFTSMSGLFGTKADGLYSLDSPAAVSAVVGLGRHDFGTEQLKALPACYVGCASSREMILKVALPSEDEFDYEARSCSDNIEIHRIDPGKGLRENWFGLSLLNQNGGDFVIASVSFAPVASGRRI